MGTSPARLAVLISIFGLGAGITTPAVATTTVPATTEPDTGTQLFNAVDSGDVNTVQKLLDSGVSPDVRDAVGDTPLLDTALLGKTEVAALLIRHGANLNVTGKDGATA